LRRKPVSGLLDRKIARVCARQNGRDVSGRAAIKVGGIWAISHQTALSDIFAPFIHDGQPKLGRNVDHRLALARRREGTNQQQSALNACGNRLAHDSLCRLWPWQIDIHEIDSKRLQGLFDLRRGNRRRRQRRMARQQRPLLRPMPTGHRFRREMI
jgi:hypothetical protein